MSEANVVPPPVVTEEDREKAWEFCRSHAVGDYVMEIAKGYATLRERNEVLTKLALLRDVDTYISALKAKLATEYERGLREAARFVRHNPTLSDLSEFTGKGYYAELYADMILSRIPAATTEKGGE